MLQLSNGSDSIVIDARKEDISSVLNLIKDKTVIGHNLKFDCKVIKASLGITLTNLFDTMLACQVLECGKASPKGHFTLESCVRRYVDPFAYSNQGNLFLPFVTKKVRETFDLDAPFTDEQITYGALDAEYAFRLREKLAEPLLDAGLHPTLALENKFLRTAVEMELNGLPFDVEK